MLHVLRILKLIYFEILLTQTISTDQFKVIIKYLKILVLTS